MNGAAWEYRLQKAKVRVAIMRALAEPKSGAPDCRRFRICDIGGHPRKWSSMQKRLRLQYLRRSRIHQLRIQLHDLQRSLEPGVRHPKCGPARRRDLDRFQLGRADC